MRALVYSHLYELPATTPERRGALRSMLTLWYDHLRGPGRFNGDVLLFTNAADVPVRDVRVRPIRDALHDPGHAFLNRVLAFEDVPVRDYDVAIQMDSGNSWPIYRKETLASTYPYTQVWVRQLHRTKLSCYFFRAKKTVLFW